MKQQFLAALLLCATCTAQAQPSGGAGQNMPPPMGQGPGGEHRGPPPASVERAAIHKLIAQELARQSGRSAAEIVKMLASSPPPEVARSLGLQPESMKALMQQAHETLISKALAAGLIDESDVPAIRKENERRMQQGGPPPQGSAMNDGGRQPPQRSGGGSAGWSP